MNETVSFKVQGMIENLLHVHALANMARGIQGDNERDARSHIECAKDWMPRLQDQLNSIKAELENLTVNETTKGNSDA